MFTANCISYFINYLSQRLTYLIFEVVGFLLLKLEVLVSSHIKLFAMRSRNSDKTICQEQLSIQAQKPSKAKTT